MEECCSKINEVCMRKKECLEVLLSVKEGESAGITPLLGVRVSSVVKPCAKTALMEV